MFSAPAGALRRSWPVCVIRLRRATITEVGWPALVCGEAWPPAAAHCGVCGTCFGGHVPRAGVRFRRAPVSRRCLNRRDRFGPPANVALLRYDFKNTYDQLSFVGLVIPKYGAGLFLVSFLSLEHALRCQRPHATSITDSPCRCAEQVSGGAKAFLVWGGP